MEQLFDDLDDFGSFDDVVSGNVRDPFPELARLRREEPVQRIEGSNMPGEAGLPVFFIVYRFEEAQQMLRDNETFFSSSGVIAAFGPVLGERVMLGMDEPVHGRLRALISKAFSQKSLARFQDELVARVGNELIDASPPTVKPIWSRSSRSPTRAGSSPDCWDCPRRTTRSSSAGRSRCLAGS